VESKEPRAKIKSAPYPIWEAWVEHVVQEIEVASRKGIPRGEQLPFPYKKLLAAILMTIYPRGLRTTEKVGSYVKASSALIRKWRRESRFQAQVQKFEIQFALYVLANLSDDDFLLSLYKSDHEPIVWSDRTLLVFSAEILNALGISTDKDDVVTDLRKAMQRHVEGYVPFEVTEDQAATGLHESMLYDLARGAIEASLTKPKGRGRKPYDTVRYRTAEDVKKLIDKNPSRFGIVGVESALELIEDGLITGMDRNQILEYVRSAKFIVGKALEVERENELKEK
jgi:hypothetical protein